jgi:hypothetical protein
MADDDKSLWPLLALFVAGYATVEGMRWMAKRPSALPGTRHYARRNPAVRVQPQRYHERIRSYSDKLVDIHLTKSESKRYASDPKYRNEVNAAAKALSDYKGGGDVQVYLHTGEPVEEFVYGKRQPIHRNRPAIGGFDWLRSLR